MNERTPEETKKALGPCEDTRFCGYCELERQCRIKTNALTLIHQLERERDAAVADLREADAMECMHCAHYKTAEQAEREGSAHNCAENDYDCENCRNKSCACKDCRENSIGSGAVYRREND